VSVLLTRLTPRLRTALNVFEGQSSLIQYELSEEAFAAGEEGYNAFSTEFLPVLSSILAPYQVRPSWRRTGASGEACPFCCPRNETRFAALCLIPQTSCPRLGRPQACTLPDAPRSMA
jgi:hypothetical protein